MKTQKDEAATPNGNEPSLEFGALLSAGAIEEAERNYNGTHGVRRRVMLATLSSSKADLLEGFGRDAASGEVLFETIDWLNEYRDHLSAYLELVGAASARLLVVGQVLADRESEAGIGCG